MAAFDVNLYLARRQREEATLAIQNGCPPLPGFMECGWVNTERVACADGFSISVQASASHYCYPRRSTAPWTHVECGFPSQPVPEWAEFSDSPGVDAVDRYNGIFIRVPVEAVQSLVAAHGGIRRV